MTALAPPAGPAAHPDPLATGATRRTRPPWVLLAVSVAVVVVLVLPLAFLLIEAGNAGVSTVGDLIFRSLTATLLWNTVRLTVVVTVLCALLGTASAWLIERTDLPGRRIWAVLVVVPLAIPDFVVSFGWSSISTWVQGFRGAVLVMTLAVYPLVYLPVAASLRNADPVQEEVARSLGLGRVETFWRVTLRQARGAILGGSLLVVLVLLAEYGAFEILGYQTFTTEIFTELNVSFNVPTASALALVLVLLSVLVLGGEAGAQAGRRVSRKGALAKRMAPRLRLGRWRWPVLAAAVALVGLAVGVPIGSAIYWIATARHAYLTGVSLVNAAWHTAVYSGCAAALTTAMAVPVALLAVRHRGGAYRLLERSTYLVLAMPGVVIALALSYFAERYAGGFMYQSAPLLVLAYAILFFPL
ncbi:MAG: ABC transporter permease, partial [Solirubrobacteraceae bacterium]